MGRLIQEQGDSMPLAFNLDGPAPLRGNVFTAVGTSVALTGGLGVAQSAALILSNPKTSGVKLTPIRISLGGTGVTGIAWGVAKTLLGTASLAPAGAGAGGVTIVPAGLGTGSSIGQVWGTGTLVNGTAGPASNNAWVIADLVGALATNAPIVSADLNGLVQLLPGESAMLFVAAGITAAPQISWAETNLITGM
jgi:hypothetical protein